MFDNPSYWRDTYASVRPSFLFYVLPLLTIFAAIAGGVALYLLFVRKPRPHTERAAFLHGLLTFRILLGPKLLQLFYCMVVAGLAAGCLILLFSHVFIALLVFVLGNAAARLLFEIIDQFFVLCRTVNDRKEETRTQDTQNIQENPVEINEINHPVK